MPVAAAGRVTVNRGSVGGSKLRGPTCRCGRCKVAQQLGASRWRLGAVGGLAGDGSRSLQELKGSSAAGQLMVNGGAVGGPKMGGPACRCRRCRVTLQAGHFEVEDGGSGWVGGGWRPRKSLLEPQGSSAAGRVMVKGSAVGGWKMGGQASRCWSREVALQLGV